ncbi:Protein of unknown function [Alkalibacterium putridalgicola]|uniref:DUF421 domain-containing protein n=1 Tax=Alkalibacterium putridalgicola TaxID=426703 RepID=A0A1H7SHZ7_9LACT|nr:YetF domain-containing protein [Alkalibacterium putridalgicola]GEK88739.1 DUF421 domain-containing protein [Alkalibacterium putridalgicola]SEL72058.1 Protein of unknown function [Alkalibacterium putridalgicola]
MTISLIEAVKLIAISVVSFISIVLILRSSGKRTLSKMNAFDFIVTVALGSVLATTIVNYKASFWSGILTFAMLVTLQHVATWLSVRYKSVGSLLKSDPALLYYNDTFQEQAMRKERVDRNELKQAIRKSGYVSFEGISAIILESDGTLTVMSDSEKRQLEKEDFIFIEKQ